VSIWFVVVMGLILLFVKFGITGMKDIALNIIGAGLFSIAIAGYVTPTKIKDDADKYIGVVFGVGSFAFFTWLFIKINVAEVFFG
jgi:hypothetical protein